MYVNCRDIRCSSVSGLPDILQTNGTQSKPLNVFQNSNSLASRASFTLSPSACTSTSPDGSDCHSEHAFPAGNTNAHEPNTSNHPTLLCDTEIRAALQANSDTSSASNSHDASVHGPTQCTAASPICFKEGACTRARSPAVEVLGLQPLKKPPKGNSVKQYHQLDSLQGVVFYQALEVTDEYGKEHTFDVRDDTQGALVRQGMIIPCGRIHTVRYDRIISPESGTGVL